MSTSALRVVHYLNQFFAGIGGEDRADEPVHVRMGPVGPGLALQRLFGDQALIVATVIGGDNYCTTQPEQARAAVRRALETYRPDVVIAGPAFNAGRYGLACGAVCRVAESLGIPAVTALYPDNPALAVYGKGLYVLPTEELAASMPRILPALAAFALRLARREAIGPAIEEGYLPRGIRRDVVLERTAAERAIALLKRRLRGEPFRTELPVEVFERVPPAPPVRDLARTRVALVTTGGIVPKGNPDRLREYHSIAWAKYWIGDLADLTGDRFEPIHGGYDSTWARQDPDRVVPLDALRELEREGVIGGVHPYYYVTTGVGTTLVNGTRFGQEIAQELHQADVGAVVLTAT